MLHHSPTAWLILLSIIASFSQQSRLSAARRGLFYVFQRALLKPTGAEHHGDIQGPMDSQIALTADVVICRLTE